MKKLKKLIVSVSFQIGVNIIGLPVFETHDLSKTILSTSKFHK
jgi:hypothetical protein